MGIPPAQPPAGDLWKKHEFLDGLYRFYLEKIIGFHTFYLPIVGGVAAYVLAHPSHAAALGLVGGAANRQRGSGDHFWGRSPGSPRAERGH